MTTMQRYEYLSRKISEMEHGEKYYSHDQIGKVSIQLEKVGEKINKSPKLIRDYELFYPGELWQGND